MFKLTVIIGRVVIYFTRENDIFYQHSVTQPLETQAIVLWLNSVHIYNYVLPTDTR